MVHQLGRLVRDVKLTPVDIDGEARTVLNNCLAICVDKDKTAYIDILAWGKMGEAIAKYFNKGDEILITGEIRNKKSKIEQTEVTRVFLLVTGFEFTYGNKRENNDTDDTYGNLPTEY